MLIQTTKLKTILIFATLVTMLTACSIELSVENRAEKNSALKPSKIGQGITSGSVQMKKDVTTGTYKISASAGTVGGTNTVNNSLYHQTPGGYKIFSTVQGTLVSK